jgi:hypothetical protein
MLQNKEIRRGDDIDIVFTIDGDYSSKVISFIGKRTKELTASRILEKVSTDTDELETVYTEATDQSEITVHILQVDTQSLTDEFLYFDIFNDTDNETPIHGKLWLLADVQTPYDGSFVPPSGVPASSGGVLIGTTAERLAYGLTLAEDDAIVWTDTDENTPYFWNGTEWV